MANFVATTAVFEVTSSLKNMSKKTFFWWSQRPQSLKSLHQKNDKRKEKGKEVATTAVFEVTSSLKIMKEDISAKSQRPQSLKSLHLNKKTMGTFQSKVATTAVFEVTSS